MGSTVGMPHSGVASPWRTHRSGVPSHTWRQCCRDTLSWGHGSLEDTWPQHPQYHHKPVGSVVGVTHPGDKAPQSHMVSWRFHLLHLPRAPHMASSWQGVRRKSHVPLFPQSIFGRSRRSAWGRTHGTSSATLRTLASSTSPCASSSSTGWTSGCGRSAWLVRGLPLCSIPATLGLSPPPQHPIYTIPTSPPSSHSSSFL